MAHDIARGAFSEVQSGTGQRMSWGGLAKSICAAWRCHALSDVIADETHVLGEMAQGNFCSARQPERAHVGGAGRF